MLPSALRKPWKSLAAAAVTTTVTAAGLIAGAGSPAAGGALPLTAPANPYMAANGASGPHNDSYSTNRFPGNGPGSGPVHSQQALIGACPTILVNRAGMLIGNCVDGVVSTNPLRLQHSVRILDPNDLTVLASLTLTPLGQDGLYNYLDHDDRLVLGDGNGHISRIEARKAPDGSWSLARTADWDVSRHVIDHCGGAPSCDYIVSVKPDWLGRIWFSTTGGVLGVLDTPTGNAESTHLPAGEQVIKAISASPAGIAVASDHALYLYQAALDGHPRLLWREAYDRGSSIKPGQRNQGTGTSPTFFGPAGFGYLTIMDNADGRGNMLVYRTIAGEGRRLMCKVPLFTPGASATDDTFMTIGGSVIATNTYGYDYFAYNKPLVGGLTRVDITRDGRCVRKWTSTEAATTMPKLAAGTGQIHFIDRRPTATGADYGHVAVDIATGRTAGRQSIGADQSFEGIQSSGTFTPDGVYYQGTLAGVVRIAPA